MSWPAPGIYRDVSPADYFALTELNGKIVRSNSTLKDFARDPALFRSGYRKKATTAMRRGSLLDCLLTSPHRLADDFIKSPFDNFKTKAAQEWRDAQTLSIFTERELESAVSSIKAIQSDRRWREMTEGDCGFQVAVRANINGNPFKCLIDLLPDPDGPYGDAIVDVKRLSQTETLEDVLKTCRKFEYNRQGGLYRGMLRLNGQKRDRYLLFIIPSEGPITPCVLNLGEQMLANGAHAIMRMDAQLTECERTGYWPGRFDGIKEIEQADEGWNWTEKEPDLEEAGPQSEEAASAA